MNLLFVFSEPGSSLLRSVWTGRASDHTAIQRTVGCLFSAHTRLILCEHMRCLRSCHRFFVTVQVVQTLEWQEEERAGLDRFTRGSQTDLYSVHQIPQGPVLSGHRQKKKVKSTEVLTVLKVPEVLTHATNP